MTVFAVVEPKSTPITCFFIRPLLPAALALRGSGSGRHPAMLDRFQHCLDAAVEQFVLVEGLVSYVAFKHRGWDAELLVCRVGDHELRIGEGSAGTGRMDYHAVDLELAAKAHDQINQDRCRVVVWADQIVLSHTAHWFLGVDE